MRRFAAAVLLAFMICAVLAGPALADPNDAAAAEGTAVNPGVRIGQWIQENVTALFPPLLALIAVYYLVKREFSQFIGFAVFATIVALFVYAGDAFKDAAVSLSRWVIGK